MHDWTQPLAVACESQYVLTVQGQVRYQGIANAWVGENDAEVTVEVHAIPPMNENGPDQWEGDAIVWSISNMTTADAEGRFSISLTILDEQHHPNTRQARISLTRCGPDGLGLETAFDQTADSTSFEMIYDKTPPVSSPSILDEVDSTSEQSRMASRPGLTIDCTWKMLKGWKHHSSSIHGLSIKTMRMERHHGRK